MKKNMIRIARGAGERSVPVARLEKQLEPVATTSVAIAALGIRVLGTNDLQSERPKYSIQLGLRCPLLLKYDVILLITSHHLLSEGLLAPLAIRISLLTTEITSPKQKAEKNF